MESERRTVNNHIFLLGLDYLYREAMKEHERGELLDCARQVASALQISPAHQPVEGYYAEDERLTEYFQHFRALQEVREDRTGEVGALPAFQRLREVASSPIYGRPQQNNKLLPVGRDSLSAAMVKAQPHWTMANLTAIACDLAHEMDDYSLVGLAARIKNPVVLTALRESVVLYAEMLGLIDEPPEIEYIWAVDDELVRQAGRFIDTFNALFDENLPSPEPRHAERFWEANKDNEILGRCVRLGYDDNQDPPRYYHWAICLGEEGLTVQEFWHLDIWTTTRYREALKDNARCPDIQQLTN